VPDAVWRQRGLVDQVSSLFGKLLLRKEVLTALRSDPTLEETDRSFALEVAQSHAEDLTALNDAAWNAVKVQGASKDACARALSLADAAVRLSPENGNILNTLGVAQYRAGRYADALTTLMKSEKLNATQKGSPPSDLAFLAMTQHQLGKKDQARATLGRLREAMKQSPWAEDADSTGFLREAEELIEGSGANKKP
jgi:Flp pilus assembly protein TadD